MTVTAIDNGDASVIVDTNAPDARSQMLTSAAAIAATVVTVEGTLAETAKAWGHALFRACYVDGMNMDAMIGDSKVAAGFSVLATSDAGRKAKGRLEVYFSNARKVAEAWTVMEQAARDDVLAGLSSIHYIAGQLRKAESDAAKAEKKRAALLAAEAAASDSKAEPVTETEAPATSFADAIKATLAAINASDDDTLAASYDVFADMIAAFDARINAAVEARSAVA